MPETARNDDYSHYSVYLHGLSARDPPDGDRGGDFTLFCVDRAVSVLDESRPIFSRSHSDIVFLCRRLNELYICVKNETKKSLQIGTDDSDRNSLPKTPSGPRQRRPRRRSVS
jgi:hypothetical protein